MYQTSLYYRLRASKDKKKILDLFFRDWADGICNEEVSFSTINFRLDSNSLLQETIRLDFINPEDALAMKLKGIPVELQNYLQIIN